MKKESFLIAGLLCLNVYAFCQVKITKATRQKTYGGMGGIFMNYAVGIANKSSDSIVIDSVKTIADPASVQVYYNKTEKTYCELAFSESLAAPPKCKACPEVKAPHFNFTGGIIVYISQGKKRSSFKVKKFKQLPDLRLP